MILHDFHGQENPTVYSDTKHFDPSWRPREQIITTFLIIDVQKPVNTIIEHVNLIFHYLFYRSQISLKMTEL